MTIISKENNKTKIERSHDLAVLYEQTSQIYAAAKNGILTNVINSIILTFVLWPVISHSVLLIWLSLMLIVSLVRSIIIYRYKIASPSQNEVHVWTQRFLLGSTITSVLWAASSIWLFQSDDLARQVFLAFVVGGMAAGAISSLSYIKSVVYIYLCLTLIPLAIRFFISGSELSLAMGSMITLALIVFLQSAKQSHTKSKQNIEMRIDNIEKQRSLSQSEHRYETLLETATDAFLLHDLNGKIIDVNNRTCQNLGYTKDELLALSVSDIDVGGGKPVIWSKLKDVGNASIESVHRRKDGSTFPVEVGIGYIQMENQPLISVLARDITERKRIEKMKNEFISTVSHELRTPLTSIRGSLGLMMGGAVGKLPPQAEEILAIAGNNTERLLLLINDILDIQKIETDELDMEFEKIEVMPFLKQAIDDNKAYAEQYGVKIVLQQTDEILHINANKARLMQVMANLLSNAAKFSHENGEVEISVTQPKSNVIRISVADHGRGIAKEFYSTIFDKFTQQDSSDTRQKGGTGLGLNITKAIIEKHGGQMGFTSELDAGSTFYFELPESVTPKD